MKKLVTLLAAAGMVVASNAPASAMDIKADGFYRFTFENVSSGFQGDNNQFAGQRVRLGLSMVASENLSGYTQFQLGTREWGMSTGAKDNSNHKHGSYDVQTRQAYIDWVVPATSFKVRMGRSQFGMPEEAFGSNSFMNAGYGGRDGVIVSGPVADWMNVTALWCRAASEGNDIHHSKQADVFGVAADLKFNGIKVSPWAAYSSIEAGLADNNGLKTSRDLGAYDNLDSDSYNFGVSATLAAFDPFTVKASFAYGKRQYTGDDKAEDRDGWNVQALASYKLGFGTPVLGAWYGSGDDKDDANKGGWMPTVNGQFTPTIGFHDGAPYSLNGGVCTYNIAGTWGVQAGIEGVSFLSGLTHDFKVAYIGGTNHSANANAGGVDRGAYDYLTTEDAVVSIDLVNTYKIYKNLTACLEIAYIINDFDNSADMVGKRGEYDEDDWRLGLSFNYKF